MFSSDKKYISAWCVFQGIPTKQGLDSSNIHIWTYRHDIATGVWMIVCTPFCVENSSI